MSPDRDEELRETIDDEPRSIFSAFWFRVVLVILTLGVVAAVALPYLLDVIAPSAPRAERASARPEERAAPTPVQDAAATAPAVSAPEPAGAMAAPTTSGSPGVVGMVAETARPSAPASAPVAAAPKKADASAKADVPRKPEGPKHAEASGKAVAPAKKPAAEKAAADKPAAEEPKRVAAAPKTTATAAKAVPPAAPAPPAATPAAAAPPAKAAVPEAALTEKAAAPPVKTAATAEAGGYWVQVGAFRDGDMAQRVAASLRGKKFRVDESVKRTAAAPVALSEADRYSVVVSGRGGEEIKKALTARSLRAEAGSAGWTVVPAMPLADAVALSRDLAVDGLTVQVRRVDSASRPAADTGAAPLHRVRVGPYPDRQAAVAAVRQLETAGYKPFIARGSE